MNSRHKSVLSDKVALVTGAGSGIGYAIADRLLAAGAQVALHYFSSEEKVRQLSERYDNQCHLVKADFSVPQSSKLLFEEVWSWRRRIDILVNNAALIDPVGSIDDIGEDDLTRAMQVNFVTPFMLSKMILNKMCLVRSGRVLSISSIGVKYSGSSQTTHYMASKAALEAGTLALAKTAASEGVLVNVLRAGVTRTPALALFNHDKVSSRKDLIPLGRVAEPNEIAEVVLFLVSPLNTYITGAMIPVAGGE